MPTAQRAARVGATLKAAARLHGQFNWEARKEFALYAARSIGAAQIAAVAWTFILMFCCAGASTAMSPVMLQAPAPATPTAAEANRSVRCPRRLERHCVRH